MKKWIAMLLALILILSVLPPVSAAEDQTPETEDIWTVITRIEDLAAGCAKADSAQSRSAAYAACTDLIISAVENSENFVPGSIVRHGDFFYWDETDGTACGYSPRLRAQIRESADPDADPEAFSGIETVSYAGKGGYPSSINVAAFQPYIGIDGSFTAQYENRCNSLAQALGGTGTTYKTTNATIDNIAHAIETCAVVLFDSHGDTDYASGNDYTSRANTSYICLQSGAGFTSEDQQTVQGPYGSYKHAYYGGGYGNMNYYMADGTAISNHMTGNSPHGLLWMAICLGMATDGMHAPLRAKGLEVAYGYSQSVTFAGDYAWEGKFWPKMIAGDNVKNAIAYMKQQVGCPDPYTSTYPAYPIVVSSEDPYPGHGNVDRAQTVNSTWTLYQQYEIIAVSNNTEWGTVRLADNTITASPKTGYYTDGYQVLSGQATVTQDGNVFTVDPQSDCTIQINFAPRDPAVVHFSVPEGVTCADLEAYVGDEVALPTPEGDPAVESRSFRFLGWVTAPMAEDSLDLPEFLNAGTKIKLTATESTYYALYTYYVAVDGLEDDQFVRVDEEPRSWAGEYVITYQGAYGLSASTAFSGYKIATKKAVVDLAAAGCVYESNILNGVTDEITYVIAPAENGTYTVKMKTANYYLAMASNTDSMTTYTSSSTNKTRWNITFGPNGPVLTNAEFTTRSLQYDDSAKLFKCFSGTKKPLTLFAKADGDNWYTTDPQEKTDCTEHVFGDWITETEPTCTETGLRYHVCTVCGFKETETIDALGHDYVAVVTEPTCTEGGFTTFTCSRCGDTYTGVETDPLGHAWDEGVVTTEPTETSAGVKTFTCTRCGATREEELPMLVHECPCAMFTDMPEYGTIEHAAIDWAYTHAPQITDGMTDTSFGTNLTVTRAQAVTFLWRADGKPEVTGTTPFTDLEADWYKIPVLWAYTHDPLITDGMTDTTFEPDTTLNRAMMITFLYRQQGAPEYNGEDYFAESDCPVWYKTAMNWAVDSGVITADTVWSEDCPRVDVVVYLFRVLEPEAAAAFN